MKAIRFVAVAGIAVSAILAHAQTAAPAAPAAPAASGGHDAHHGASAPEAASPSAMVDGEVRKVDRAQGKLTLRHGPIPNLEMPSMTMVFKVTDPKFLDSVSEGDKVRFAADRVGGSLTVTTIERLPK